MRTVAVVGASLAGWRAAQELREQGFDGRLVMVGAEAHSPYDRPPLSKEFLGGELNAEDLALGTVEEETELQAEWRLGVPAVRLNTRAGAVVLADGTEVRADGVVIATGAVPATLPGAPGLPGSHLLRTVEDAVALRGAVHSGSRVVVVGAGLVGSEVASTCHALGARVTVVEAMHVPLVRTLGIEVAPVCAALHEDSHVRTRYGTPATHLLGEDRVTGVALADGRVVPADVVVVAVGVRPATEWLRGSGLGGPAGVREGVPTDSGCMTRLPNVAAVGDVARYHCPHRGHKVRFEHWSNALEQPRVAVRNLLAGSTVAQHTAVPQFWSEQYGCKLQFAGYTSPKDKITVVEGAPDSRRFVVTYHRAGRLVAVFAMNSSKQFAHYRRRISTVPPASARGSAADAERSPV